MTTHEVILFESPSDWNAQNVPAYTDIEEAFYGSGGREEIFLNWLLMHVGRNSILIKKKENYSIFNRKCVKIIYLKDSQGFQGLP